jgi:chemotaxis protein histidine kinase CheA
MSRTGWIVALGMLASAVAPGSARAAGKEIVQKIESLNTSAIAAYKAGDYEKARAQLMDALVLGKKNDLDTHPAVARTYLDLGVVQSAGLKDHEKAQRYFGLAVRIKPDIEVPPALASDELKQELEQARARGSAPPPPARAEESASAKESTPTKAKASEPAKAAEDQGRAREESEKLRKQLAEEKEAKEKLEKARADAEKQLAAARDAEKKEREDKEKLAKEKVDTEKQLAAARDAEKKERETREKLEKQLAEARDTQQKEKQLAETRDKERKGQEEKERLAREKMAEGPDLPSSLPRPLTCPIPDEGQQGADLYVHCAVAPTLKAKAVALYYRPSGVLHFNSLAMERNKKGWYLAVVPATYAGGMVMKYLF